jgi:hypothetical protein
MPSEQFVNDIFDTTEIASTGVGDYLPILRQASGERLLRKIKATAWSASLTFSVSQITATGTPDSTTFLRGDGAWASPSVSLTGLLNDRGSYNASGNVFPSTGGSGTAGAILKGDLWTVSVAGTLGGHAVTAGDVVRALADAPGQTDANWAITENNLGYVAENSANKVTAFSTPTDVQYPSAKLVSDQLTLKQDSLTFPLSGANGGTGVANSGKTITLGGNLVTSGAFNTTITSTATTNSTLPAGTHNLAPLDSPAFITGLSSPAITDSGLTAGRVAFAGTGGLLSDDADMTFATDTLTVTKLVGSTSVVSPLVNATTGIQINGAATSRKLLVGNGTNFIASTETWAVPGTSGNILTSDGTNWTSAAPAASGANTALSNLASVAINTDLLPASTQGLGSATFPFAFQYLGSTTQYVSTIITANTITYAAAGSATNIDMVYSPKGGGNFSITKGLTVQNAITAGTNLNFGNTGFIQSVSRANLSTPADGIWLMANAAVTGFDRLQLGGTTSSFPAIKRSAATLAFRLADDSADAAFSASTGTLSGNLIVSGAASIIRLKGYTVATLPAGTQGDTAFVTDALAPTFLATVVGGGSVVTPVFFNGAAWVGY